MSSLPGMRPGPAPSVTCFESSAGGWGTACPAWRVATANQPDTSSKEQWAPCPSVLSERGWAVVPVSSRAALLEPRLLRTSESPATDRTRGGAKVPGRRYIRARPGFSVAPHLRRIGIDHAAERPSRSHPLAPVGAAWYRHEFCASKMVGGVCWGAPGGRGQTGLPRPQTQSHEGGIRDAHCPDRVSPACRYSVPVAGEQR
jgi:hypothetical protein